MGSHPSRRLHISTPLPAHRHPHVKPNSFQFVSFVSFVLPQLKSKPSALRSLLRRPVSEWTLLLEALGLLLWSRLQLHCIPFARIAPDLGTGQAETLRALSESQRQTASKISWAVLTVSRYFPLKLVCLPQAMAATSMLKRRGIPSTLYLGVKISQADSLTAHAWSRAGKKWVTGNDARRGQTVVACFAQIGSPGYHSLIRPLITTAVILVISILSLIPHPPLWKATWSTTPGWLRQWIHTIGSHDFAFTFTGFLLAGLIYNLALFGWHRAIPRYRWLPALLFATFAIILECLQLLLPGRNFDPMDIIAGILGITLATLFWIKPNR